MRAIRLLAAAVVLAALSTLGASAAQANASASGASIQYDNWQW